MQTAIIIALVMVCSAAASLLMGRFIDAGGSWDDEPDSDEAPGGLK